MSDIKFSGEIHVLKDGIVAKFDRSDDHNEQHDHQCRPFKTAEAAETYLLDKGVDLEDIETVDHTTPEHAFEPLQQLGDVITGAIKHQTERLEGLNRLNSLLPEDKQQEFKHLDDLEADAFQLMIILAKYDMPITPEELEAALADRSHARG